MDMYEIQRDHSFFWRSVYQLSTLIDPTWQTTERYNNVLTFKTYQRAESYALHAYPALSIGDARWSFQTFRNEQQLMPVCENLEEKTLSTVLYYMYGFSHYDQGNEVLWPFHRFVPSARCLFPAELYLCLPSNAHLPAGLYHYDPLHHRLIRLRQGNYLAHLAAFLGARLDETLGVLLISAFFGKTAALYKDFAYRLCTQEAGLLVGNALLVAAAMGWQGQVHYQFLDHEVNRLCGLMESDEGLLAAVALYPWPDVHPRTIRQERTPLPCEGIPSVNLSYLRQGLPDPEEYAALLTFHEQTCLTTSAELRPRFLMKPDGCDGTQQRLQILPQQSERVELAEALRQRNSGDVDFLPLNRPMPLDVCCDIVRYTLEPYSNDVHTSTGVPSLDLFVAINAVAGVAPGIYRFCTASNTLQCVTPGEQKQFLQALQTKSNINVTSANLVCFLVGNYAQFHQRLGERAYRVLHLETGLIAQRLCVMSAAHGVVARYSNSFRVAATQKFLQISDPLVIPVAEIIIGYERPGAFAGQRYRRSLCC